MLGEDLQISSLRCVHPDQRKSALAVRTFHGRQSQLRSTICSLQITASTWHFSLQQFSEIQGAAPMPRCADLKAQLVSPARTLNQKQRSTRA